MVKIVVDEDLCIGCGACAATCPDTFKMDAGKSHVIGAGKCAKAAEAGCPVDAISVSE